MLPRAEPIPGILSGRFNIASRLRESAARFPAKRAVVFPAGRDAQGRVAYTHRTFAQLDADSDALARGLVAEGIGPGTRTLLMVRPSHEFIALTWALFKVGAVPILIDPGMGRANLLGCIAEVEPEAMIAIPLAHAVSLVWRAPFKTVRTRVTVGTRWLWGGTTLAALARPGEGAFPLAATGPDDEAAILFTTGSTGAPKGVVYTHGIFDAQVRRIRETYGIAPDDVELPGFPLFALYDAAWGVTCVIPDMDPTRPAEVDPARLLEAIEDQGVTLSFGSPAIWKRVAEWCVERGRGIRGVKRILMAGAPVPGKLLARYRELLPDGETHTPYGATECLPVATISGREVVAQTLAASRTGKGTCVGRPLPGLRVEIIRVTEEPLARWSEDLALPWGRIGEIAVKGEIVTPRYFGREAATTLAKIPDPAGGIWHRMGDLGWMDVQGRIWFCGRKSHRVETGSRTFYSVCCEAIFNEHPRVARSALVGIRGAPAIVVEPLPGSWPGSSSAHAIFRDELLALGAAHEHTAPIRRVLFHPAFPVDIRHNAKIFREKLAVWAEAQP